VLANQSFTAARGPDIPICVREVAWHEGDVVRKLRGAAGWTLKELEERSGVHFSVIHGLEIGTTKEPKRATLTKLAEAFGLTPRELSDLVPTRPVRLDVKEAPRRMVASVGAKRGRGGLT
jgi:transcriptional regulator with XRE-family HTH domain